MRIPHIDKNRYRLLEVLGPSIKEGPWIDYKGNGDLWNQLADELGEEGVRALHGLSKELNELVEVLGKRLPPVDFYSLVEGSGVFLDQEFKYFVQGWVKDKLPEAVLDKARPEDEYQYWDILPRNDYKVYELVLDPEGEALSYWGVEDRNGNPIDPDSEEVLSDWPVPDWKTTEVEDEGKTYIVLDSEEEADACAVFFNKTCQGYDEFQYPEWGFQVLYEELIPLLQDEEFTIFHYHGKEGDMFILDGTEWNESYRLRAFARVCARYCEMRKDHVMTKGGPRMIQVTE